MNQAINICSLFLLLILPTGPVLASFAGGDGSKADPWQIAKAEQLDEVRNQLGAHYILISDIDLTAATGDSSGALWNDGAGWEPIGAFGSPFIGSLDGNGFTITGLSIDRGQEKEVGLFRWTGFGAVLTGLALEAVDISGGSLVGGLVVTNYGGTVTNSYVTGRVGGKEFVGGLVGRNLSGKVTNSYVTAKVNGTAKVGGLVGSSWSAVTHSYATGRVRGDSKVGGLVGINPLRTVKNSYWNTETSGQENSSGGGTGLTSDRMSQQASFAGFDFDNAWQFPTSAVYPVLKANPQETTTVGIADSESPATPATVDIADSESPATPASVGIADSESPATPASVGIADSESPATPTTVGIADSESPATPASVGIADSESPVSSPERADYNVFLDGRVTDIIENSSDGELIIFSSDERITAQPYSVRQASPGQEEGIFINENGDLVWVTADRREVSGHPLLADKALFNSMLEELDLQLQYGERANMRLSVAGGVPRKEDYLSVRADLLAVPAPFAEEEGLFFRPVLRNVSVAYLVFMDENGVLMQQDLVPVPADWPALKKMLAAMAGISNVRMDPQGIITVSVNGLTVRARMDYRVIRDTVHVDAPAQGTTLTSAGDVNGDGAEDIQVHYPDGVVQLLLIIP